MVFGVSSRPRLGAFPILAALLWAVLISGTTDRAFAQSHSQDAQMFERAMALMQEGEFSAAEPVLIALRNRHPHTFRYDESLGLLYAS